MKEKNLFSKKSAKRKKIFISCILLAVVISGFLFLKSGYFNELSVFSTENQNTNDGIPATELSSNKYVGQMESVIEYGDRVTVVAHYPVIGTKNIDASVLGIVESQIKDFKNEIVTSNDGKGDLYIDYESYVIDNKYVSVAMSIEKTYSHYAHPVNETKNAVYEISSEKQLLIDDVITEDKKSEFLTLILNEIKTTYNYDEDGLAASLSDYVRDNPYIFYFDKEGFVFKFDEYTLLPGNYGVVTIKLNYSKLSGLLKTKFNIKEIDSHIDLQQINDNNQVHTETKSVSERYVDPDKPMVALTFDDGPHPEYTRQILEALKRYNGAATFYLLGNRASAYSDVVTEIISSGSEVGNHSWSHDNYTNSSASEIRNDKNKVQNKIKEITGNAPATIRVPYGAVNQTVTSSVEMPVILWSVDTNDWKYKDKNRIVDTATTNIKDGDIILMHDIWKDTGLAVPEIAEKLSKQGFQLVTVSEMAKARGISMENGKKYFSFKK